MCWLLLKKWLSTLAAELVGETVEVLAGSAGTLDSGLLFLLGLFLFKSLGLADSGGLAHLTLLDEGEVVEAAGGAAPLLHAAVLIDLI